MKKIEALLCIYIYLSQVKRVILKSINLMLYNILIYSVLIYEIVFHRHVARNISWISS